jgi:hypothetical protein
MCKPNKTGGANRWTAKEREALERTQREIADLIKKCNEQYNNPDLLKGGGK